MRKSPVRHKVQSHLREGDLVHSFERGKGSRRVGPHKIVGVDVMKKHGLTELEMDLLRRVGQSKESVSAAGMRYALMKEDVERYLKYPGELKEVEGLFKKLEEKGLVYSMGYDSDFYRLTDEGRSVLGMDVPPRIPVEFGSTYGGKEHRYDVMFRGKATDYLTGGKISGMLIPEIYPPLSGEFYFPFCGLEFVAHGEWSNEWTITESRSGRTWVFPVGKTVKGRLSGKKMRLFGLDKPDSELSENERQMKEQWTKGRRSIVEFNKVNILRKIVTDILVPLKHTGQFEFTDLRRYSVRVKNLKPISYEVTGDYKLDGSVVEAQEK